MPESSGPTPTTSERQLSVEYKSINSLKPYPGNPRTHPKKQIRQIARSIEEYGFTNPILVDGTDWIIAGHARFEAAKLLGLEKIPTIQIDHPNEEQKRALRIADNKIAENAAWDNFTGEAAVHAETDRTFAEIENIHTVNSRGMPVDDADEDNSVTSHDR